MNGRSSLCVVGIPLGALSSVMIAAIIGCGSQTTTDASVSAAPSASVSAKAPSIAQPDYCKRVCERATTCGNEDALRMKGLEPEAKAAVEKSAAETTSVCIETCVAEAATPVRLQLADRCNQTKDCAAFAKCLTEVGSELKK